MSVNKLGIVLFCGFLIVATVPFAAAQDKSQAAPSHEATGNVTNTNDVRQAQTALSDLMYNPGQATGMMTSQTQQAIREFQWLNDLPVTGNLDEQTDTAIMMQATGGSQSNLSAKAYGATTLREKPSQAQTTTRTNTNAEPKQKDQDKDRDKNVSKNDKESSKEGADRIAKSAEVLQDLTNAGDKKIPNELLERAEAILVIPHMIKGAFGIGGRYGKGVVSERSASGRWSPPAFVEIGGGSFGAQIGVSATDLVLVFTDRKSVDLLDDKRDMKLGVDAGVAAGPIGRSAEAGVNLKLDTAIYAYSRSKGLFAGVALDGAVLDIDHSMNEKVYGTSANTRAILNGTTTANATVQPFLDTLEKVMPKKRVSQK